MELSHNWDIPPLIFICQWHHLESSQRWISLQVNEPRSYRYISIAQDAEGDRQVGWCQSSILVPYHEERIWIWIIITKPKRKMWSEKKDITKRWGCIDSGEQEESQKDKWCLEKRFRVCESLHQLQHNAQTSYWSQSYGKKACQKTTSNNGHEKEALQLGLEIQRLDTWELEEGLI